VTILKTMRGLDVSRETMQRLEDFEPLLTKWNNKINLVSSNSLKDLWVRHIADSIQVFRVAPPAVQWVDLGSGGGFPGLIVAILAVDECPDLKVSLIESDQRKAAFLRTVVRKVNVDCEVISERIEKTPQKQADIVSARALADLVTLLEYSDRHLKPNGTALFSKGVNWKKELDSARQRWRFDVDVIESLTRPGAVILKIKGAARV